MSLPHPVALSEVVALVGGEVRGDADRPIRGLANLASAGPDQLAFVADPRYKKHLFTTQAGAVLLTADMAGDCPVDCVVVSDPYTAYAQATGLFEFAPSISGIHITAVIDESARLGDGVAIGAYSVIGPNVSIGADTVVESHCNIGEGSSIGSSCHIHANVTLYHGVYVGNDVRLHSGVVVGADGFGYAPGAGGWTKIHQLGSVRIGDRTEVGACTTIDRGALDDTVIGNDVIIDNHCQIAHNVTVGDRTAIAGCVGIAGSATIGSNCLLGGGAGIAGHITVADNVKITGMALVSKSIAEPGVYSSGTALSTNKVWQKNAVRFLRLDEMHKRLRKLEKNKE